MKKYIAILLTVLLCFSFISGCSSEKKEKAPAYPTKPIEVVVPFTAGGGSSITAQIFAQIINEEKYLPVSMNIVNKPGGNMAVGMSYTAAKRGDPYYIMLFTPSYLITPLQEGVGVNKDDFTPIVVFGSQLSLLCAHPDSQFKSMKEVVEYAKANPGKLTIAGSGTTHEMYAALVAKEAGFQHTYVPFSGTADAAAAVLGKHVDLGIVNIAESVDFIEAKQLIGVGIASKERVSVLPDVPTYVEQGINFTFGMARGVVAPADIPEEARQILGATFKKLCESERWKTEYLEKYDFTPDPMYLDDAKKYLDETEAVYKETLKQLGLIK